MTEEKDRYGYELVRALKVEDPYVYNERTVCPVLRRLELDRLLESYL